MLSGNNQNAVIRILKSDASNLVVWPAVEFAQPPHCIDRPHLFRAASPARNGSSVRFDDEEALPMRQYHDRSDLIGADTGDPIMKMNHLARRIVSRIHKNRFTSATIQAQPSHGSYKQQQDCKYDTPAPGGRDVAP
ncbi:MAG: hypothetical protein U1F87_11055 [Kiritimatiellia bacterium]